MNDSKEKQFTSSAPQKFLYYDRNAMNLLWCEEFIFLFKIKIYIVSHDKTHLKYKGYRYVFS